MNVYKIESLTEKLASNEYPGRGIVLGTSKDGKQNVAIYFIMGRSVNSRNRIFALEPDGIRTEAYDPSLLSDPSLIIYHPVREWEDKLVVTNGDQTDTIVEGLKNNVNFFDSLQTRCFEPDGPNWTPRISGMVNKDGSYCLSILKSADEEGTACIREGGTYPKMNGLGHFIHTYNCNGNPIPTFTGEPERVEIEDDIEEFAEKIWQALNPDNKISLFVRYTSLEDGTYTQKIFNKFE